MTTHKPTPEQQRRRKVLRYSRGVLTVKAMRKAIAAAAPPLNESDAENIISYLGEHIDDYTGPERLLQFRTWAVAWVTRIARLTVTVRPMLPAVTATVPGLSADEYALCGRRLLSSLHEFTGDDADAECLKTWACEWALNHRHRATTFDQWYRDPILRQAVKDGLRDVLKDCCNLGISITVRSDGQWDDLTVAEIESDLWLWVSEHMVEMLQPGSRDETTVADRLRGRARFEAMRWKTDQLRAFDDSAYLFAGMARATTDWRQYLGIV